MDPRAFSAMMFTVVVWGIGPVFLRSLSVDLGPSDHLAIRYTIVTAFYVVGLAAFGGWRIERQDWPRLLVISLIGMIGYNLGSAFGFAYVSAGIGSLIIGTQPLLIALMGSVLAKERLTAAALAGSSSASAASCCWCGMTSASRRMAGASSPAAAWFSSAASPGRSMWWSASR